MYVTSTCSKCRSQWGWDTDADEVPFCPKCGYDSVLGGRRSIEYQVRPGSRMLERDSAGKSELDQAVIDRNVQRVQKLLAEGADARTGRRGTGETPLHLVASGDITTQDEQRWEIARLLLEHGADRLAITRWNETAYDMARFYKRRPELLHLLNPAVHQAIRVECPKCGAVYHVPADRAGQRGRCKCGETMQVPAAG